MRQVDSEQVDTETRIILYLQNAAENFRKAHQSGDMKLMWAVLKNTQDTIGGYEAAAHELSAQTNGAWE